MLCKALGHGCDHIGALNDRTYRVGIRNYQAYLAPMSTALQNVVDQSRKYSRVQNNKVFCTEVSVKRQPGLS